MNRILASAAALLVTVPAIVAAQEDSAPAEEAKPKVEVVKVGEDGKPEIVRIEGFEMKVCKGDVKDGCINPEDAGFDWGGKEIKYWPGKPASEIDEKLPVDKPPEPKPDGE